MSISYLGDDLTSSRTTEGVAVGLTLSLQRFVGVFVGTNANGLSRGNNCYDPASRAVYH